LKTGKKEDEKVGRLEVGKMRRWEKSKTEGMRRLGDGARGRPGGIGEHRRWGDCEIERRNELVTGKEDATIFSGLNILLTKLYQMDIPSITGYLK